MKYKYNGQWYDLSCSLNVSNLLIGEIIEYAGESMPGGYLVCDGSAVSRTEYSELFDVIGTLYGSGDGSTTFNLPDLRGRVVTGLNTTNSNFNILGKTGGEETHTLTVSEIPSHNHTITTFRQYQDGTSTDSTKIGRTIPAADGGDASSITSNQTGGGQAHNNLQPYITINYLIRAKKTKNVLASGSTVVNSLNGDSTVDAPSVRAVNEGLRTVNDGLGNIKGKILWTNPNTTAEFHAQSITLSSSDYDTLEWYFRVARDKEYVMVTKTIKGWSGKIINYNDDGSLRYRYMNRNNDISYGITSPGFDGALVPMYVVGYNMGLFNN